MLQGVPNVLALDFDGVLCDGLKEYFKTAWQAYCNIWQLSDHTPPDGMAEAFYRLRPVVETGWEMPIVLRAIARGMAEADLFQHWATLSKQIIADEDLDPKQLATEVDGTRDRWIDADLESWLAEHRFYPGVCDRLKAILASDTNVAIISTKEGRFIQQLLQQQGIDLTNLQLFGKETKRPKGDILLELMQVFEPEATFWFVEDRLKTLQTIQKRPELESVNLFLADWGYNTPDERHDASQDPGIHLISLDHFASDFSNWLT
mgnify:CR=1 FL=1